MPNENRITFWGDVDQSTVRLEEANEKFARLWTNGEFRMSPDSVERMTAFLDRIQLAVDGMRTTTQSFKGIALPPKTQ